MKFAGAFNLAGDPVDLEEYFEALGVKTQRFSWRLVNLISKIKSLFSHDAKMAHAWLQPFRFSAIFGSTKFETYGYPQPFKSTQAILDELIQDR